MIVCAAGAGCGGIRGTIGSDEGGFIVGFPR